MLSTFHCQLSYNLLSLLDSFAYIIQTPDCNLFRSVTDLTIRDLDFLTNINFIICLNTFFLGIYFKLFHLLICFWLLIWIHIDLAALINNSLCPGVEFLLLFSGSNML